MEINKTYLTTIVSKIMNADGSEEEINDLIIELQKISTISNVTDLIFFPENGKDSIEAIVEIIANHKIARL